MKTEEDEAFDEIARKQGHWGGGFMAKRAMAADKLQEPAQSMKVEGPLHVVCQCDKCKAQPAQEPKYEYLIDDLAEWKQYVEVDNAPYGLREHVTKVLLAYGIKEKNNE